MFFYGRDLEAAQAHENEAVAYLETLPQFDKAFIGDRKRNYADLLRLKGEFNHDVSEATGLNPSDVEAVKWDTYYFLHDDSQTNGEGNQLNLLHGFDQIYGNQG